MPCYKRLLVLCLLLAPFLFPAGPSAGGTTANHPYGDPSDLPENAIVHVPTGIGVTVDQMMEVISASRVIYIGETHDNLEAHRVQLEVIARLAQRNPGKIAVGMEMFRHSAQSDLDRWHQGALSEKTFRILFRRNWGPSYNLYRPIFDHLKQHGIPLLALKSSRYMEDLFRTGDPPPWPARFPKIDADDALHRAQSLAIFGGHQDDAKNLEKPYRMLLLWEETMAQTVSDFLRRADRKDWKLVVLAGGFHVQYGFGIPKRAFRRLPHAYSIVLPTVTEVPGELQDREMKVEAVPIPLYSADFIWKVPYKVSRAERIRLGVHLREDDGGNILVTAVQGASIAEKAGILKGDQITTFKGEALEGVEDLVESLQMQQPGDRVDIGIRRDGTDLVLDVPLEAPTQRP